MSELIQCKRKPPVLLPLSDPLRLPPDRLKQRIHLITNYALSYRELDDIEARELLNLKHILQHGSERPRSYPATSFSETEVRNAISALLD